LFRIPSELDLNGICLVDACSDDFSGNFDSVLYGADAGYVVTTANWWSGNALEFH
jgi:hypothetical protein